MGEVIDISDRGKLMGRIVEEDAVQLVEMGSSGKNYCLVVTKNALTAIREGRSFPLELLVGEEKMTITVLRNTEFKKKLNAFKKLSEQAKDSVAIVNDKNEDAELGKSLGEKLDQE